MRTNRVISRAQAAQLNLESRIELEMKLTDAEAERVKLQPVPTLQRFEQYRNRSPWRRAMFEFLGPLEDRIILDVGCGYNPTPIYFALAGARKVYACDVSPNAVNSVRQMAEITGVADRVNAFVSPAERLPLERESVDLIHGEAVLHHVQLRAAAAELARVLRKNGRAVFKDPLGQNPLLEFARDHLPYRWKKAAKGTDRPLKFAELACFRPHFRAYAYRGFGLASMLGLMVYGRGSDSKLRRAVDALDSFLLDTMPGLQRYCRFVVTCAHK